MTTDLTKPVRTRSGLDVRILCTDAPGEWPVRGYYLENGEAISAAWTMEGLCRNDAEELPYDLVNVPETTKRWVLVDPDSSFVTEAGAGEFATKYTSTIELTYEGDKLTAVKIVEDE